MICCTAHSSLLWVAMFPLLQLSLTYVYMLYDILYILLYYNIIISLLHHRLILSFLPVQSSPHCSWRCCLATSGSTTTSSTNWAHRTPRTVTPPSPSQSPGECFQGKRSSSRQSWTPSASTSGRSATVFMLSQLVLNLLK